MNYTDFIKAMQCEVKEQMEPEVVVDSHTAVKNNGTMRTGLVLMCQGVNMSPTIYLEEFYEQYLSGISIPELARMVQILYEKVKVTNSYPYENIMSYRKIREKIAYKLIRKESNEELLEQIPYEEYFDLAVVFYILLENTAFGSATLLIRNEHLRQWRVTKKEVYEAAKENTPVLLPADIEQLTEYMYVMTNKTRNLGAAAILYPDALKKAARMIGGNFYILPSSIHEVILIPESYGASRMQLEIMVEEINENEVAAEEVLSDTVYYYSSKEQRVL